MSGTSKTYLKKILAENGNDYVNNFRYSILETHHKFNKSREEIINRENHWKTILQTRQFGYNRN